MIAIVGGGIAGLSAAYRLRERGHDVRVFEAGGPDALGGLARTYATAGDDLEQFYHHLSKSEETIVELAEELGVGDDLEWLVGKNAYYVDGVVHPMDTPWEILAFPHWSVYDKFRLGMLTLDIDVRGGVPSFDTYENLEDFEHQSAVDFAKEHTTENVYETFFDPLLDAKFGSRKDEVSAAWLLGRIKFRGERDLLRGEILGYFDGGFRVLLDALVDAVGRENIETNARVTRLATEDGAVSEITVESEGEGTGAGTETRVESVDDVVVATMPNVLEDLTGYACEIDFQGAVCAVVTMEESLTDIYWLNVADEAPFGALIEHTNFVPPERYGGDHLLYVASYVQSPDEWLWDATDGEIEERWLAGIEDLFPAFDPDGVSDFRLARAPRAAPIYEQGYLDLVVPYDLGDEVTEGLYYAGMASRAQYPERSLNGGVVAGYEVADRIDGARTRRSAGAEQDGEVLATEGDR
ncbi:NAD(P)/FAD-dependent oxidoreductase [Halorarum halophilum]|uniref:NAD(P)/FAD-dependent oxidoreductase n=1 Tax=Halorarum halophilum TaxID=2743090 RepID=A0A7D5KBW4_9EURY|nr:NAD(P)/FAD-dependent oxidoreductase [Halobaculum halophilum]QLG26257.1 NAD(P)/FAD-dependent oxidoreductase [Halobaculum halophilum]